MAKIKYNVCVLTVTYGNRWQFLKEVIHRVLSFDEVSRVIIADNASTYSLRDEIVRLFDNRVHVLHLKDNTGSAGGYEATIKYAKENTNADFFWLLDDDNLPEENALQILLDQWEQIQGDATKKALYCLRPDRAVHIKIAQGQNPYNYYLVPDNFFGFSVFRIFKNQYRKFKEVFLQRTRIALMERVIMPYVPYGGLFIHHSMINTIGYPNKQFYLYVDDSEFTYRITQNGGTIWMISSSKIIDIDKSQGIGYKTKLFHSSILDLWSFRSYYLIRNTIYFNTAVAIKNRFVFSVNKILFLSILKVQSLITNQSKEYKKVLHAINDGLNGNLGKADPKKL